MRSVASGRSGRSDHSRRASGAEQRSPQTHGAPAHAGPSVRIRALAEVYDLQALPPAEPEGLPRRDGEHPPPRRYGAVPQRQHHAAAAGGRATPAIAAGRCRSPRCIQTAVRRTRSKRCSRSCSTHSLVCRTRSGPGRAEARPEGRSAPVRRRAGRVSWAVSCSMVVGTESRQAVADGRRNLGPAVGIGQRLHLLGCPVHRCEQARCLPVPGERSARRRPVGGWKLSS